jgi:hypothetical protein
VDWATVDLEVGWGVVLSKIGCIPVILCVFLDQRVGQFDGFHLSVNRAVEPHLGLKILGIEVVGRQV